MKINLQTIIVSSLLSLVIIFSTGTALASTNYYTNSNGTKVHVPVYKEIVPVGATAKCRDSSYSYSQHRRGTCSHHGGVSNWLY